jgi:hypothetical protein
MKNILKNTLKKENFMRWLLLSFVLLAGCAQITNQDDEELRTTPVTNNPNIVPHHGQSLIPGMESPR